MKILIVSVMLLSSLSVAQKKENTCGEERQPVKTLADKTAHRIDQTVVETTVTKLRAIKAPDKKPEDTRIDGVETTVYRVRAELVGFKLEADQDFHIVIREPGKKKMTMIGEIPSEECAPHVTASGDMRARLMQLAEVKTIGKKMHLFKKPLPIVIITGVGFFDKIHGQTGVAPNGIELHPWFLWELESLK